MKKNLLICSIIFSFFILSFSSCINSDFDLGDDKLDTTVDVGDSISVPVGDIQRINVYDELKKVYHDSLGVRPNGVLYVKYDGTFNIEFPDFKLLEIDVNPPDEEVNLRGPDGNTPPSGVELPISSFVSADEIISGEVDVIEAPRLGDGNITLAPEKIEFTSLTLEAGFTFSGLDFFPEDNNAIVEVILVIPKKYDVEGVGEYREIKKEFPFNQIKDGSPQSLGELKVKSYMFGGNEKLCYRVYLKKGNATSFSLDGLP
ncbi:MAG: hypothetical protein LBB73_04295, partial [Dysgonamonadaceae bacterium]|nr:hypothetical protein [Dysgonamonadaceae bacterium]